MKHTQMIYYPGAISNATWRMYHDGEDYYAEINYSLEDQSVQRRGVLRANPTWDDFTLTEKRTDNSWQSLLDIGAGDLIFRTANLLTGGLVLHSSVLDDNGMGVAFVGHSGAGKSTQLEMWLNEPGVTAINDDRVAVRVEKSGPVCYGTPWGGTADIALNCSAPLSALIVLEQAPENEITRLSPAEAAPLLAPRSFLPYWDAALMRRAMANLNSILANVPVYRLRNRPGKETISLVRSVL